MARNQPFIAGVPNRAFWGAFGPPRQPARRGVLPPIASPVPNPFFNPAFVSFNRGLQGALGQMASVLGANQAASVALKQAFLNSPLLQQLVRLPIERMYIRQFSPVRRERVRIGGMLKGLQELRPYVRDVYRY